jgi:hypothetical protein
MNGQMWSYVHIAQFRRPVQSFSSVLNKESRNNFHKLVFSFPIAHKFKTFYGITRVTSVFRRACYTFVCTARLIQPTASYPSYLDIYFNIILRICLYITGLFNLSCEGFVTFHICLACSIQYSFNIHVSVHRSLTQDK